jgi:signal transduction histidine kinase
VLALYTVVLTRPRRFATLATAGVAVAAAGLGGWAWWYAFGVPLAVGALAWGRLVNDRRDQAFAGERQREHQLVVDERLRIARELHDVVTHGMGLIAVKAGIANHLAETRPEEARDALRIIEATSRESLTELRRLLGVLREDADLAPAPTLDALPELVERASMAGVEVEAVVAERRDLPPPVELAAYRIVQEALTNVVKHAAPARCRVSVRVTAGVVAIEVADDGTRDSGGRPGHGLVGMRERVALYDGEFAAGPAPSGGFTVTATLRYQPGGRA